MDASDLNNNNLGNISVINNTNAAYERDLTDISINGETASHKSKNVRLIYCGDGIVEEDEEEEEERLRKEKEEKEREIELRKKMDLEAKSMTWLPWMSYMASKTAYKSLEACDYMGEKLAWWFGITKPKFLYEIEEYERMKKEEEERNKDDIAEEIVVGKVDINTIESNRNISDKLTSVDNEEVEMSFLENNLNENERSKKVMPKIKQQQQLAHSNSDDNFYKNNL